MVSFRKPKRRFRFSGAGFCDCATKPRQAAALQNRARLHKCADKVRDREGAIARSPPQPLLRLQQLIRINVDGDGDVFGEGQFVEGFADEAAQADDGLAADQDVKTELAL